MADDPREAREIPKNWREYLKDSGETFRVYAWAFREFVPKESIKWIRLSIAALLCMSGLAMVEPLFIREAIDGLARRDARAIVIAFAVYVALQFVGRLFNWGFDHFREYVVGYNAGRLDVRSTELFFAKSLGQHSQDTSSLNAASVEKGRGRVIDAQNLLLFEGIPVFAELGLAYAFLLAFSPLGFGAMLALLGIYSAFMLYLNRRVLDECTPIDTELRAFNRYRVERWENIERVKSSGQERAEAAHMTAWWNDIIGRDRDFWHRMMRVYVTRGMINMLVTSAVFGWGLWLVWSGTWTVGLIFPFSMWLGAITRNLWRIAQIEHRLNWSMPSVRAMMEALTLPPDVVDRPDAIALSPDRTVRVEFRGVGHDYRSSSKSTGGATLHVLDDVSFTIEPGERVALLGPSGAGKTTVMKLLQRFTDPAKGAVLVDGHDLRDIKLESWQRLIGYISQQAQVLDGTLRYNLTYGLSDEERAAIKDEDLQRIVDALKLDEDGRFTEGLDTMVGRRGIRLSGGQAQRVMVAAAIVKKPHVLVVDEATSSLDSTTEKAVQLALTDFLPPETSVLIITHRLPTVRSYCTKHVLLRAASAAARDGGSQVEAIARSFEELHDVSATFRCLAADQDIKDLAREEAAAK